MLEHTPDPAQTPQDAAHARVKVDMIARAIAALEERKQQQAREMEGTAVIGDVVRDLQLDVTAEELLAEVQAQTKAAADVYKPAPAATQIRTVKNLDAGPRRLLLAALIALLAALIATTFVLYDIWMIGHYHIRPRPYPLPIGRPMLMLPNPSSNSGWFPADVGLQRNQAAHPLSAIANGHPFGMTLYTLSEVLEHKPLDKVVLYDAERDVTYDVRKPHSNKSWDSDIGSFLIPSWTGIKYDGKVYLRGWTAAAKRHTDPNALFSVFNVPSPIANVGKMVPITLPLDNAIVESAFKQSYVSPAFSGPPASEHSPQSLSQIDVQEMFVRGLPQDPHLWEPWKQ